MADGHRNAGGAQPGDIRTLRHIAALDGVAQIVQHLGNARHADAANANKMDGTDGER